MYSTPKPTKTYGRKLSMKDRHGTSTVISQHPNQSTDDEGPPRKRRILLTPEDSLENNAGARYSQTNSRKTIASVSRSTSPKSSSSKEREKEREVTRHLNESTNVPPESSSAPQSSLSTPKKNQGPKDLWEIFNAVSPSPSKSQKRALQRTSSIKPTGLAKRMLSRSRTESSIESSPKSQEEILPRSYSMADSPSRSTIPSAAGPSRYREKPESQNDQGHSQSSTSEPSGSQIKEVKNVRRTYAGQSRSFLLALPASSLLGGQNGSKAQNLDDDDDSLRDSYQELRRRWGVDNSEDSMHISHDHSIGSTGEGLYNPLFSITDLRSKGESRRFMDEIGYLFEGLAPTSALSVRRSSAFDIISKLCNQEFWRKTRAAGLIGEIWDQLRAAEAGNGDKVLDSIMCCFVSLAAEEPRDISSLAAKEDFVTTAVRLLETHSKKDPFAMSRTRGTSPQKKGHNTSDIIMIKRLNDVIGKMLNTTREGCQPSVRLLLSNAFAAAPHLAFPHISIVMDSLVGDLSSLLKRLTAYRSGLPLLPDTGSDSLCLYHIHNCLAILDSFLLGGQNDDDTHGLSKSSLMTSYPDLEAGLTAVNVAMNILEQTSDFVSLQLHASRCSDLSFRILINLTNDDPEWVNAVASDEYTLPTLLRFVTTSFRTMSQFDSKKIVREGDDEYARSMDRLCLSLALLTNLAQESKNLTSSLQATKHASSCLGTRKCVAGCCCEKGVDSLASLVNIYVSLLKREEDSPEQTEADFNFLRGHFAVLLGLLILQGPPRLVIDKLPGSSSKFRLRSLMQNITEFAALYNSVAARHDVPDDDEPEEENRQSSYLNGQSSHTSGNDRMSANVIINVVSALEALQAELS